MALYTVFPTAAGGAGPINEVLVKEDVSDLITNLFPLDTPLQQILSRVPMSSVFTEQPVDTFENITRTSTVLTDVASSLPKPEGHTYASGTPQYPARLKSVAEIQGDMIEVSETDSAVSHYGIGDAFVYRALKTTQKVVNDFELSFWWALGTTEQGADFGGGTYNARQTQGLMPWILHSGLARTLGATAGAYADGNGNDFNPSGVLWDAAGTTAFDANGLTLDQTMFKQDIMSPWWELTGRTGGAVGFASPRVKGLFSQFALTANGPVNERTLDAASRLVVDTVDYYETDFGIVSINMCRYLSQAQTTQIPTATAAGIGANTDVAWNECLALIHPRYFNIGVVRPVYFSPLGKDGDFERGLVRGEQALVCRNPQAGTAAVNCVA